MLSTVVLVGIAAGGTVFVGTILLVYFLLSHGGSFERMKQEAMGLPTVMGELKPQLYDELLELARRTPRKPALLDKPLNGHLVTIRDFVGSKDAPELFAISCGKPQHGIYRELAYDADEMVWRHLDHGPFASETEFLTKHCVELPDNRHFVITHAETNLPIGMVSLCSHSPLDLRVEISNLWLTPAFQGSGAMVEAVLLILQHLFRLKYRRVEWRCDGHNVRARRAGHSLGFSFEGVLRKHCIVKDSNRDTVLFAVVNSDWPVVEEQLISKVANALSKASTSGTELKTETKPKTL